MCIKKTKKITSLALLTTLFASCINYSHANELILGDINGDNVVNQTDLDYANAMSKMDVYENGWERFVSKIDFDSDNKITEYDIDEIKKIINKKEIIKEDNKANLETEDKLVSSNENNNSNNSNLSKEDSSTKENINNDSVSSYDRLINVDYSIEYTDSYSDFNDYEYIKIMIGDINNNGQIESNDLDRAYSIYYKRFSNDDDKLKVRIDMDKDGSLTQNDLDILQNYVIGGQNNNEYVLEPYGQLNNERRVLLGDLDNNKSIDEGDLNRAKYMLNNDNLGIMKQFINRVDVDLDGSLTQNDIDLLKNYVDGKISSFNQKYASPDIKLSLEERNHYINESIKNKRSDVYKDVTRENRHLDIDHNNIINFDDFSKIKNIVNSDEDDKQTAEYKAHYKRYEEKSDLYNDGIIDVKDFEIIKLYLEDTIKNPTKEDFDAYYESIKTNLPYLQKIKNAVFNHEDKVDLSEYQNLNYEKGTGSLYELMRYEPLLQLYLSCNNGAFYNEVDINNNRQVVFNYYNSEEDTLEIVNAVDQKIDEIIENIITDDMSDIDKVYAIRDYMVENVKYDPQFAIDGAPGLSHSAYNVLVENIGVCDGFSGAMKMILDRLGIESEILYGHSIVSAHAWNLITIDGLTYHIDMTLEINYPDEPYRYMFVSDKSMELNGSYWNKDIYGIHENVMPRNSVRLFNKEDVFDKIETALADSKDELTINYKSNDLDAFEIQKYFADKDLFEVNVSINEKYENYTFENGVENPCFIYITNLNSNPLKKVNSMSDLILEFERNINEGNTEFKIFYNNDDIDYTNLQKLIMAEKNQNLKFVINEGTNTICKMLNDNTLSNYENNMFIKFTNVDTSIEPFFNKAYVINSKDELRDALRNGFENSDTPLIYLKNSNLNRAYVYDILQNLNKRNNFYLNPADYIFGDDSKNNDMILEIIE
ncbi:transglutaminase domain-containing protein [Peptostreptococcaceae bacterium AGR-M142]